MRVLILGGTAEARSLAAALVSEGHDVTSSLAGRVSRPRLPVGRVRIGGFGGSAGLARYLAEHRVERLVDATHPFATTMTRHAVEAAAATGVPALRLARPGWSGHPDVGAWHWVDGYAAARVAAERLGSRPLLTTGRQTLDHFRPWADRFVLVRLVEPLEEPAPTSWTILRDRGPFSVEAEVTLMREHAVDVLLTKDSGGAYTSAKLDAARELGVPVVVVRRPALPSGLREVADVAAVADWLR
ncbi:MAG: cobalt-precorrin-6A reductase [Micrococcales bacterium]|nr:cobalt-precorrin-6A reductase [Micrococcales bacterium]